MLKSIWHDSGAMPHFPELEGDTKTDVLIIGGGLAGILCAYMLHKSGVDYLLIEANTLCSGATQNTTAKITSQHGAIYSKLLHTYGKESARLYWQVQQEALKQYRELCKTIACDFEEKDAFLYTTKSSEELDQELRALELLDIPADLVRTAPLPFEIREAIRFSDQAQLHPLKFAAALAKDLHIREHTTALSTKSNIVTTDRGRITASKIIVTTHFPFLNKHGFYFLKMYQQRAYVLALSHAQNVEGMYRDVVRDGFSLRSFGDTLLVSCASHHTGTPTKGWSPLETFAQTYFPQSQKLFYWANQDCITLDGLPYIGQYGKHAPYLYVATGFNKWGMSNAMAAAMILCDLVQDKENDHAALFAPSRSILHPQLAENLKTTAANFFTFRRPRCPHLGCALVWNPREHAWECPCHGSRFSASGTCLNNPAKRDLHIK